MAVLFKLLPKINTLKNPPETKYYPRAVHRVVLDFEELSRMLEDSSTVTQADCYAVMVGLTNIMAKELSEGHIVRLGDFGSFQISVQGNGSEDPNLLGRNLITKSKVLFRPGKKMKTTLDNLKFERKK